MSKKNQIESATAQFSKLFERMQANVPANPMMGPQVEQFWDAQEKLLAETQRFTQHWFERRHEAIRSGLEAARLAASGKKSDPMTALTAMIEWQKHSTERMTEDAKEWFETMSRCAEYVVNTETETLNEAADMARKATKSAKSEPV
jgi:hypothetical protein